MSRRANQEGSVYQRKSDGRWCVSVRDSEGKRITIYKLTQEEAIEELKKIHAREGRDLPIVDAKTTVKAYLESWLADLKALKACRPLTLESYEQIARRHLIPGLGHHQLGKLRVAHVKAFLTLKAGETIETGRHRGGTMSLRRVAMIRDVLRIALNEAVRDGTIPANPASLAQVKGAKRPEPIYLTPEQCKKLLDQVMGGLLEPIVTVAAHTGLRRGELLGLRWADVDIEARPAILRVTGCVEQVKEKGRVRGDPKSKAGRRVIELTPAAAKVLKAWETRQKELRLKMGERWKEQGYIFTSATGAPIGESRLARRFRDIVVAADLPAGLTLHGLRHSCAAFLYAAGIHPRKIQAWLGHEDFQTTLRIYGGIFGEAMSEAADAMAKALG